MRNEKVNKEYEQEIKKNFSIKLYPLQEEETIEWVAEIAELPGCIGAGDTPEEALLALEDAKISWIEIALADGKLIPEPSNKNNLEYSGKFTLRLPKTLHRELAEVAAAEEISLNQYLLFLITKKHYEKQVRKVDITFTAEIKKANDIVPVQYSRWEQRNQDYECMVSRRGNYAS
jgi:antitoxin HicB